MELLINIAFYGFLFWCVFKMGEHMAYFRIARGLTRIKEHVDSLEQTSNSFKGIATIEKIGEQYYAYIGNNFVAQGPNIEQVRESVREIVGKNPGKFLTVNQDKSNS